MAGMRQITAPAGWDLLALEGGRLTWAARMELLKQAAGDHANHAAAFVHLQLTPEQAVVFHQAKLPLGYLGGALEGVHGILDDGFEGTQLAVRSLAALGHRRIGFLVGDRLVSEARDREAGIRSAVLDSQCMDVATAVMLTRRVRPALEKEGKEAALELLRSVPRPSALFCPAGDLVAAGAYAAAAQLGLRVPQDLSILGYDDLAPASALTPPLSTLHQPLEAMGAQLAASLLNAVADPGLAPETHALKPTLVERGSCAPPAA
jgi:DNA-binding LacI/PurR family transcriptional regulator